MGRYKYLIFIFFVLSLALLAFAGTGCGSSEEKQVKALSLKIGLMPAVDAAPVLLAEKKGYFKELGLNVSQEIYNNAQDRQSALQTHSIDGAISDLIAVAVNVAAGFDIRATTMTNSVFPVLTGKGSESKKNIRVGMMEVSVSNFLIDEWLGNKYIVEKVFINEIPARLAAIGSGQLDMGLFPEPVASMGELKGLQKKIYASADAYCPDVIVFTGKALNEKQEAVKLFHKAYNRAVDDINNSQQEARDILMEKIPNLQPEVRNNMILPKYTKATLPDNQYIDRIIGWTAVAMNKDLKVKPDDLVERKFTE
ncbi:MAG: hypothetical protein K0R50_581 [Eubacterium sp.]|jgi:NitT/TauT family transport system substrate-binding protein|nr:hypothetical protein [Eubacterium sp.]